MDASWDETPKPTTPRPPRTRGWLAIDWHDFDDDLREELTIEGDDEDDSLELFREVADDLALVPRTLWTRFGVEPDYEYGSPLRQGLKPINLWDYQVEPVDALYRVLQVDSGAILHAGGGRGKTVMALELIRRLGRSAVVFVHKTFLMDQWRKRIEEHIPRARVGVWRQNRCDSGKDYDIVLAMVQSVSGKRAYPVEVYESFGTFVADEVHRYGASIWQKVLGQFPARYRIGLTATPRRSDGREQVFFRHIGHIGYSIPTPPRKPMVRRINLDTYLNPSQITQVWDGECNTSKAISMLAKHDGRTRQILEYVPRAYAANRRVILLTARLAHIERMKEMLASMLPPDAVVYHFPAGAGDKEMRLAEQSDVVLSTYQMAKEGFDMPSADTLMLATPQVDVNQAIYRILRDTDDKQEPVVLDFVDHKVCTRWWDKDREKWEVKTIFLYWWGARRKRYQAEGYLS